MPKTLNPETRKPETLDRQSSEGWVAFRDPHLALWGASLSAPRREIFQELRCILGMLYQRL